MQNMSGGKSALGLDANVVAGLCYVANLVCYLGVILSIIVLVTDKSNKLARFHAAQSLLLIPLGIVLGIVYAIGFGISAAIDSQLGFPLFMILVWLIVMVIGLGLLVMTIIAAVKGFQGQIYKLPIIGKFADNFSN